MVSDDEDEKSLLIRKNQHWVSALVLTKIKKKFPLESKLAQKKRAYSQALPTITEQNQAKGQSK